MVTFIAQKIMAARDVSLENGQNKYRTYFIKTKLYKRYQTDVDLVLTTTEKDDGSTYEDCIVAE